MATISSIISRISELAVTMGDALQLRGFKTGGTVGQVPVKGAGGDFNWSWGTPVGGTVTSVSVVTANGVSATVATATSTPAITIVLGAITPTSVAASGTVTGSNLSGTNTGDQTNISGNAATATSAATLTTARTIDGVSFNGSANITVIAPATAAATSKTTPVDADSFPIQDSAAASTLKQFTFANLWTWIKAKIDAGMTIAGVQIFSSTTRPTVPNASGTPAATSLITFDDLDNRLQDTTVLYLRDDFCMGSQATAGTIGELGWEQYGVGTGKGVANAASASPTSNPGQRVLTSGNADTNGQTIYISNEKLFPTARTAWQMTWVFKTNQTTLCDVIAGMTGDSAAIGIAKFGGISVGVRYSSATDTDFMFYSKNSNTTFAANDANNYSVTSGVAVDTNFHTVRMRSTTLAVIEMSIDGGAWVAVTYTPLVGQSMIPFFYVATRTAATKSATIDFFSFYEKSLPR